MARNKNIPVDYTPHSNDRVVAVDFVTGNDRLFEIQTLVPFIADLVETESTYNDTDVQEYLDAEGYVSGPHTDEEDIAGFGFTKDVNTNLSETDIANFGFTKNTGTLTSIPFVNSAGSVATWAEGNSTEQIPANKLGNSTIPTIEVGEYRAQGAVDVQVNNLGHYGAFFNPSNGDGIPVLFLTATSGHYNGGPGILTVDGTEYPIPASNLRLPSDSGVVDSLTYQNGNAYADNIIQIRDFYALTNTNETYWTDLADANNLNLGGNGNVDYGYNTSTFNAGALQYIQDTTVLNNLVVNGSILNDGLFDGDYDSLTNKPNLNGNLGKLDKPAFSSGYDATNIYDASVPFFNDAAFDTEQITNAGIHRAGTNFDLVGHWEVRTSDTNRVILDINVNNQSGDINFKDTDGNNIMHVSNANGAIYYGADIDSTNLQATDEIATIGDLTALGAPSRGAALPANGVFGQRFYVNAAYTPDPILTQITTSGGTDLILDGYVPAAGGSLIGLDFRVTLGDDGRSTNADSIGNLLGALPMNLRIGDTTFTVTATNPSGPGAFGNTATTATAITAGDFSAFNYLIGENVFRSTAQPAIAQGWYAFSDQWDSISN